MTNPQPPSLGRIVLVPMQPEYNNGAHVAPAVITRVWGDEVVNVRVFADGHEVDWRTSVRFVDSLPATWDPLNAHIWTWPPRVPPAS